jgi:TP901 family phage tail tape measure protein
MPDYNLGTARGRVDIDGSSIRETSRELKNADIVLRQTGQSLINFGTQALQAFGYVVNIGREFERNMDFVQSVSGATEQDIARLTDVAIELGKNGPFGPIELSESFIELAKAGVGVDDIINGIGQSVVSLGAAADITTEQAGDIVVQTAAIFGLAAEEVPRATDLIAGAANASMIDVQDFATTLKYAGPVAAALGIDLEDLATTISLLGQSGIKGSQAGTSLRQVMLNLSGATPKAIETMKEFGIITEDGTNIFYDAEGQLKSLDQVFGLLGDHLAGLTERQKSDALRDMFGVRQLPTLLFLMEQGVDAFQTFNDEINETTAADVAADRLDNLDGSIRRFKSTLDAVLLGPSGGFQLFLKDIVDRGRDLLLWFDGLSDNSKKFIIASIGIIGILSLMAGAFLLTIGNMVRAFRVIAELSRIFIDLIPIIGRVITAVRALSIAMLTNPAVLIVAAIIALIAILGYLIYKLYTTNEEFRAFVDGLWQSIQRVWDSILNFLKGIPKWFKDTWKKVKEWTNQTWDDIYEKVSNVIGGIIEWFQLLPQRAAEQFTKLKETVVAKFSEITTAVLAFVTGILGQIGGVFATIATSIIGFLTSLPGTLLAIFQTVVTTVLAFLEELPGKIGFIIGFILGSFVKFGVLLEQWAFNTFISLVNTIVSFLTQLPGIAWRFFNQVLSTIINIGSQIGSAAWSIGNEVFSTLWNLLSGIPGFVFDFFNSALSHVINFVPQFIEAVFRIGWGIISTLFNFLLKLPGLIADWFMSALRMAVSFIGSFLRVAWSIGKAIIDGLFSVLRNLPSLVWNALTSVLNVFKSMVSRAWNAAKDFAGGLWNGFKSGLGIGSPSYIEYAMFAVEDQLKHTAGVLRRTLNSMNAQMSTPLTGPNIGLTPAGTVAHQSNGTLVVQGPLVGTAYIREEQDIYQLTKQLNREEDRKRRGLGLN